MMLETVLLLVSAGWAGVGGAHCPAGMTEVEEVGCLALHHQEYERMEWKDCRQFCWETYLAHLVEVESSSELAALGSYLLSAGVEEKHWWTGGTDVDSEGDWVWSSSLSSVGQFLWSPGQPDGAEEQNCLYLNPHYDYTGRDDNCHIRKQPLCQLKLPTTTTATSTTATSTSPSISTTATTSTTPSGSTTSSEFQYQKCCHTVSLESSGLINMLMPEYVGTYQKIVTEITNRTVYHKEDKFLFYLHDSSVLDTDAWVISTSMDVPVNHDLQTIANTDDDLCADNTGNNWMIVAVGEWVEDKTAVLRCEGPPDQCQTDQDCNEDLPGVCATNQEGETVDCAYCEDTGYFKQCTPGCQFDAGSESVPRCPAGRPVCNTETHHCQAQSGSTRLEKLVFTSHSCEGCTREGLNMSLAGSDMLLPQPRCKTVDLDHPDLPDFQSSSTFLANVAEQDLGWGNCWKAALEGRVLEAEVVWTGEGTWRPDNVCYDWDKVTNKVFVCSFAPGTALSYGEAAQGSCRAGETTSCPS